MAKSTKAPRLVATMKPGGLSAGQPRAAIYNRVSTTGQDATLAMEDLRRAAVQRGYHVALEIAETGSGKRNDRPGLQRVLEGARRSEVDAVFVMRLDRFGRSSLDLLTNIRAITDAGVRFACIEQAIDIQPSGDPMGQLVLTVLAGVAQFEHAIIVDRVREGQRRAMKRGVVFGRPRADGPDGDRVRELRTAGRSWSEVASELDCTVALARRRALAA
jgi:putative DNA-invertase from lambdoid prophage Rac